MRFLSRPYRGGSLSKRLLFVFGIFFLISVGGYERLLGQDKQSIESIEVRGTRRVPQETVKFHMLSRPNELLNPQLLRRDFRTIWETGYFDDVRIELEDGDKGKIVIFYVKERPMIRSIEYEGLKSATQTEVLEKYKEFIPEKLREDKDLTMPGALIILKFLALILPIFQLILPIL